MTSCLMRLLFAAVMLVLCAPAERATAQVRMTFDKHPVIEVGNVLTVHIRFKSQVDFREFPEELELSPAKPLVDLHRTRIGLEGRLTNALEYQIETELSDGAAPWRDAYLQTRAFRQLQIRAGQFKIPFSLDQLTSGMDL